MQINKYYAILFLEKVDILMRMSIHFDTFSEKKNNPE